MLSRRSLFRLAAALAFLPAVGALMYRLRLYELPVRRLSPEERKAISRVTGLIVPSDQLSPGAIDLKVDAQILSRADRNRHLRRVLKRGVNWLNTEASRSTGRQFLSLDEREQIDLMEVAEAANSQTPENRFFSRVRNLTMELYYAEPSTWNALCYKGPPQPLGFVDYEKPPEECDSSA